ncbi:MAG: hypothetical protein D6757_09185 [Alphaproteobacteria bacterium]|nr:MAG: hypothetical protein D6757_09185 [Alphaproteobacteria bacterium]
MPILFLLFLVGLAVLPLVTHRALALQGKGNGTLPTSVAGEDAHAAIVSCLSRPSRVCALSSALRAVAAQDLAFDRVETLIALARAFHALGDDTRAASTASLAVRAARAIGISIGTERKLAEIAPIEAAIGRMQKARALLSEISDPALRAATMARIARARARAGDFEGALKLLDEVNEPWLALGALADIAEWAAAEDDQSSVRLVQMLKSRVDRAPRHLLKWLAMARLGALEAKAGEVEKARALRDELAEHVAPGLGYAGEEVRVWAAIALLDLALDDRAAYDRHVARMLARVRSVTIDQDPTTALAEAMTALAAGGRSDEALALAGRFRDLRGISELAESLLGHPFARPLWGALAMRIVDRLKDETSSAEQDRARLVAIRLMIASGRVREAIALARGLHDDDAGARALAMLAPHLS